MVKRIQKARLFPLQSINVIHVSLFEYIQVQQQSSTKNWEQVSKNIRLEIAFVLSPAVVQFKQQRTSDQNLQ